jgi:hypothetical protein
MNIPVKPTKDDVFLAIDMLFDLLVDFPFKSNIDKSVWLAMHLTQLCRYTFTGCVPMFLLDGNKAGVGKGLLVSISSHINYGRDVAVRGYTCSDGEMRKVFTSLAIKGDPLILLDNINDPVEGSAIERVLTSTRWGDRLLSTTEDVDLPWRSVVAGSGNNVILAGETPRRVLRARVVTDLEKPEERKDFAHPRLLKYVRTNRAELLAASFIILRGWYAKGRPKMKLPDWGSFEEWGDVVRNTIVWAGEFTGIDLPDPYLSRTDLVQTACTEQDDLAVVMEGFLRHDPNGKGMFVSELVKAAEADQDCGEDGKALWDALKRNWPGRAPDAINAGSLGMKLHHIRDSVVGGMVLEKADERICNKACWRVRRTGGEAS